MQFEARQPPYLEHYGTKGQKWGIRRFQNEDGSYTAEGKERYGRGGDGKTGFFGKKKRTNEEKEAARKSQNGKDRSEWKAKDVKDLSDEELRRRNNRLNAERNYKDNVTPQWKKDSKAWAKEAAKAILVTTAVTAIAEVFKENIKDVLKNPKNPIRTSATAKISSIIKRPNKRG